MIRRLKFSVALLLLAGLVAGCGLLRPRERAAMTDPRPAGNAPVVGLRIDGATPYGLPAAPGGSSAPAPADGSTSYRIRAGDILVIVLRTPEEQRLELMVDESGSVRLPLIDRVKAEGLTGSEFEERIQKAYLNGKIFKYLTANIFIPSRSYYVRGEIRAPGKYPWQSGMTVMQALASAGGFTDFAQSAAIQIMRGEKVITFNARAAERDPAKDILVESGDVLVISRTWY